MSVRVLIADDSETILLLMRTRTYRAAPFLAAAERLGLAVSVATERSQPLSGLLPGGLTGGRRSSKSLGQFLAALAGAKIRLRRSTTSSRAMARAT